MATVILNTRLLTVVADVGLSEVPSSPSRTIFGIVPPYLCCVFMGIGIVSAENHIALLANFVTEDHLAHPFTCSVSFAKRVSHFPQQILSRARHIDYNDMNIPVDSNIQQVLYVLCNDQSIGGH